MVNKNIIENWGVPKSIKDNNLKFVFDNNELDDSIPKTKVIEELYCNNKNLSICSYGGSKFCLYDLENKKIILTMEFRISKGNLVDEKLGNSIKLDCICVNDSEMRGKKIAKYYLKKLIEFGIYNNIKVFYLYPNPDDEFFEGIDKEKTLTKKSLEKFYINTFKELDFNHTYYYQDEFEDENEDDLLSLFVKS